jgi:hypothetical protein
MKVNGSGLSHNVFVMHSVITVTKQQQRTCSTVECVHGEMS